MFYLAKVIFSAIFIVLIAELGKRSNFWGSALASLPLVSILAFIWIFFETKDTAKIAAMSLSIPWFLLPSILLFLLLPLLLRMEVNFWIALFISCFATGLGYVGLSKILELWGIDL